MVVMVVGERIDEHPRMPKVDWSASPHPCRPNLASRFLLTKVYLYLTNHSARGSAGVRTKPLTVKQRIYGHDVWRRENPELFEQRLAQYQLNNPDVAINIGRRRALISDAFRQLPEDEQEKYREMAKSDVGKKPLSSGAVICSGSRASSTSTWYNGLDHS
ncbi:hypothetical protein BDV93DRAFT_510746 [Ceratobasidium sp. AG-I]|nr:hypothetical protein BDV93DRAFT_510746 [Ceratobasidium sp. AG-I]